MPFMAVSISQLPLVAIPVWVYVQLAALGVYIHGVEPAKCSV